MDLRDRLKSGVGECFGEGPGNGQDSQSDVLEVVLDAFAGVGFTRFIT